jgi:serine/threonine protein kinase
MALERGALLHNRYRIDEILGQGGMGSVYRAVDENLGVDVAVKENLFTTDEYARQFRLEAVILANLRHPNLPRVTDHFVIGDQGQYLVMDYIEGEDLRQRMERTNSLPDDEVIIIGAAMSNALSYLHSRKPPILHRDIKPGNVKVTPDGEVFLVDFGLAKVIQGSQVTTTGARAMTPGYSPPEQYGTARTDPRTDIYSLGATLYAALTGIIPEDGLARAMENAELTPIRKRAPKVSRRLAAAIEKAMAVDPDDRFQEASDFGKALLNASSKTQRLVNNAFTVEPAPEEVPASIEETSIQVEPDADPNSKSAPIGIPVTPHNTGPVSSTSPTDSPKKRRKKARQKFIRFLLLLILIFGGIYAAMRYFPQIQTYLPGNLVASVAPLGEATGQATLESVVVVPASETPTPTSVPTETPTLQPSATATSLPTDTPTASPTPLGGGSGEFAFVSDRTGVPQVYTANIDGSGVKPITNISDGACQPEWSPDGMRLVFVSPCATDDDIHRNASLFLVDADGSNLMHFTSAPGGDFEPDWSPDGSQIAFTSLRDGYMQIYVVDVESGETTRLTETSKSRNEFARQPAWSPFGNQIAYALKRYGAYQIWVMTDLGESPEQVTQSGYNVWDTYPVWSADGTSILYNQNGLTNLNRVWLMSIALENRPGLGINAELEHRPLVRDIALSGDGFWMLYEGLEEYNYDIFISTLAGASRTRLTRDPDADYDPVWRPMPVMPAQ